ncbi:MAG: transporter substrate-binding domain-containing protein [Xanthobacteraceae bacterium]|nr:transporter substrate-binding domain-containing protein [Xanthobacteraceae bacterium]
MRIPVSGFRFDESGRQGWSRELKKGIAVATLLIGVFCTHAYPQDIAASSLSNRELVVGVKSTPPFAMLAEDGNWHGISIDLWRRAADQLHLRYRFDEQPTLQELFEGSADGKFDVSVGALTITAARARRLDFTSSFYSTGLGIAVPAAGSLSWIPVIRAFTNFGFLQAVLALLALALLVGFLIWYLERHHNEQFAGGLKKGLSSGVWWATTAMTRRGTVNYGPQTIPGRIVAVVWTVTSIIAIAIFTAAVTSALTVRNLQGTVHNVTDLQSVRVGAVLGSSTQDALAQLKVTYQTFDTPLAGLEALRAKKIDAFVYDKPLVAWIVQQRFSSSIEVLDTTFEPQNYAMAVPNGSPLRASLNVAILDAMQSDWWRQTLFRYLGARTP